MSLELHQWYSFETIIDTFGEGGSLQILCDREFVVFPRAIVCCCTIHSGSLSRFTTTSRFTWKPQQLDYAPIESIPWFPEAARETWTADRKKQLKEHHLFVKTSTDKQYYYVGPVHLSSYGRTGNEFSGVFTLAKHLIREAWLHFGGSLAPRQPFAALPIAEHGSGHTSFHRKTLELLHIMPPPSLSATKALGQLERRHELHLPASVREWYSLTGTTDVMQEISLMHLPADITEYDENLIQEYARTSPFCQMLPVMFENQGVWHLAVVLNEDNDPPVLLGYQGEETFEWHLHAHHFSDFVYAWAWDYATYQRDYIINVSKYVTKADIEQIRHTFQLQVTTYVGNGYFLYDRIERYAQDDQKITLLSCEQGIDVWFSAETVESFHASP